MECGFATAIGIAVGGTARIGTLRGMQRADALHFGVTVIVVVVIAATALVRQLDPSQPVNAWVFFASAGGMAAYVVSSLILGLRLAARHVSRHTPSATAPRAVVPDDRAGATPRTRLVG